MLLFIFLLILEFGKDYKILVDGKSDTSPSGGEIRIIGPKTLLESYKSTGGIINAKPALFGIPVYNGNFVGIVQTYIKNPEACYTLPANYFQSDPMDGSTKTIALIERGSCTFVQKVKNCQRAGAKGVVVYNNDKSGLLPIMSDDGTGDSVFIPSIIITWEDGLALQSAVQENNGLDVEIEISWGLPRPDGRVEWELWTSSEMTSREQQFVVSFKSVLHYLGDKHLFTPHYDLQLGMAEASEEDCSNELKYCMYGINDVPGRELLRETLTQICIFKTGQDTNDNLLWWDYVEMFIKNCASDYTKWDGICSTSVWEELAKSRERTSISNTIKKCVFDSGGLDGPSNILFDAEIKLFSENGIEWVPTVTINNEKYHGSFLCPNPVEIGTCSIFSAICGAFVPESIPKACLEHEEFGCPSGETRDVCGVCGGNGSTCKSSETKAIAIGFILIIVLIVVLSLLLTIYFISRFGRSEEQFDALRNMYEPLAEVYSNGESAADAGI